MIGAIVADAVGSGGVPGVVAAIGRGPVTLGTWAAGYAETPARPMALGTLFDLASLTKVVATTTAVLALAGRGELDLDDPAARYLPEFTALGEARVTLRQLLAHTSGLPDTRKFYQWCASREDLLRDLFATPLEAPPGARAAYSDLGFLALGEIVAAIAGQPLDAAVGGLVTGPLGMAGTSYNPVAAPDRFAATERQAAGTPLNGTVHDENARLMGGVAGHAGLFSTAADLAAFCAWWAGDSEVAVPAALRRQAESPQTGGLGGDRGLGWARRGDSYDILRGRWPATAVSHTGFTGTALALDSPSGAWEVLLTNAVHFGRDATAVKALRREFSAAAAAALFW